MRGRHLYKSRVRCVRSQMTTAEDTVTAEADRILNISQVDILQRLQGRESTPTKQRAQMFLISNKSTGTRSNRDVLRFASIPLHLPRLANLVKCSIPSFEKKPTFAKQAINAFSFSKRENSRLEFTPIFIN